MAPRRPGARPPAGRSRSAGREDPIRFRRERAGRRHHAQRPPIRSERGTAPRYRHDAGRPCSSTGSSPSSSQRTAYATSTADPPGSPAHRRSSRSIDSPPRGRTTLRGVHGRESGPAAAGRGAGSVRMAASARAPAHPPIAGGGTSTLPPGDRAPLPRSRSSPSRSARLRAPARAASRVLLLPGSRASQCRWSGPSVNGSISPS